MPRPLRVAPATEPTSAAERPRRSNDANPIIASGIYRIDDFIATAGLSRDAFRSMKRAGLIVRRYGKRSYVIGQDFLDFLKTK